MKKVCMLTMVLFSLMSCVQVSGFKNKICTKDNQVDATKYIGAYELDSDFPLEFSGIMIEKTGDQYQVTVDDIAHEAHFCKIGESNLLELKVSKEENLIGEIFPNLNIDMYTVLKLNFEKDEDQSYLYLEEVSFDEDSLEDLGLNFKTVYSPLDQEMFINIIDNNKSIKNLILESDGTEWEFVKNSSK